MTVILNKANKGSKIIRGLWLCFVGFLLLFAMLIFAIDKGWLGYMPSMAELENPRADLSSDIIAKDQTTIVGRYFKEDRSNITYKDISPYVINALYATEDARFTEHSGIDPLATIAIIYYAIIHKKRGSSTITQQLAKNLFPRESEAFWAMPIIKLKEMVMAVKLERNLTKQEIVTLYLSRVPFGDNVYGIRNASLTFYNKKPDSSLTINEAAMLIGMLKGNTIYNPRTHPAKALERRNVVLDQMIKYKYLDGAEGQMLKEKKDSLNYHKITYHDGIAPYFRQVLEAEVKNALKDLKKPNGEPYDIYKDGLKIYTTIDIRMQQYAEEAMEEHLRELQKQFMAQRGYSDGKIWESNKANIKSILNSSIKASERYKSYMELNMTDAQAMDSMRVRRKTRLFAWKTGHQIDTTISGVDSVKYMKTFLQAGFMVLDPTNAQVKAWVGGIDHKFFQYDHVNKNTKRQVGSTIKPLLYTLAIKNGGTPCDMLSTSPQSFPGMEEPYDAGGKERGTIPMKTALAYSVNNAALYLLTHTGIDNFVNFAKSCGIESKMEKFPSVALGVSDISLYEMMGAYTMFPNYGDYKQPQFLLRIEDKNGVVIKEFPVIRKPIIDSVTAYKMIKMMRGVVNFGTGVRLRYRYGFTNDIAGKTGTTNDQADAWFIGYTPHLMAGAWVGCDDREFKFRSEALGQGSAAALPIWALFMQKVYKDKSLGISAGAAFKPPAGYIDCDGNSDTFSVSKPANADEPLEHTPLVQPDKKGSKTTDPEDF